MLGEAGRGGVVAARLARVSGVLLTASLLFFAPGSARAWTEARVTGASARVDLSRPPLARVTLSVRVHVSGGWLSRFEIVGLEPDLVLAADAPATLVGDDGSQYAPHASSDEPGSVLLGFDSRHAAPWRGDYTWQLSYDTRKPFDTAEAVGAGGSKGLARVRYSLPRWPVGLQNVHVTVLAQPGARASRASADDAAYGDEVSVTEHAGLTELEFSRVELPRTQAFEISCDVPAQPSAASVRASAANPGAAHGFGVIGEERELAWAWLWLVAALALGKRWLTRRGCARQGLVASALVPLPSRIGEWLRVALVLASFALARQLWIGLPLTAAGLVMLGVVLALDRKLSVAALPSRTQPVAVSDAMLGSRLRDWLTTHGSASAWLDATTLGGVLTIAALGTLASMLPSSALGRELALRCVVLALPVFFSATRRHRPWPTRAALRQLRALAASLAARGIASELRAEPGETGTRELHQPQLVLRASGEAASEPGFSIVVAHGAFFDRPARAFALLAWSAPGSARDALLAHALPDAQSWLDAGSGARARLCITQAAEADATALLAWLAASPNAVARAA